MGTPCQNMDPGMECEFSDQHQEPPSSPFFFSVKGPQKLSSGSHKDGWGSACMLHFPLTVDGRWALLWQVSVPLQAKTSGTGRIAPWRGVCSKVIIVTSPPSSSSSSFLNVRAPGLLSDTERLHKKKGSLQGDEMRLQK